MTHEQIDRLMALNDNELYEEIYVEYSKVNPGILRSSSPIEAGKLLFRNAERQLYDALCVKHQLCKVLENEQLMNKYELVAMVADFIAQSGIGVPPFAISALLMKMGIRKFCGCSAKGLSNV